MIFGNPERNSVGYGFIVCIVSTIVNEEDFSWKDDVVVLFAFEVCKPGTVFRFDGSLNFSNEPFYSTIIDLDFVECPYL